jgi:hypothetical protein
MLDDRFGGYIDESNSVVIHERLVLAPPPSRHQSCLAASRLSQCCSFCRNYAYFHRGFVKNSRHIYFLPLTGCCWPAQRIWLVLCTIEDCTGWTIAEDPLVELLSRCLHRLCVTVAPFGAKGDGSYLSPVTGVVMKLSKKLNLTLDFKLRTVRRIRGRICV